MAEYIKFRLTAAKVGVSMALMALIAGVAEKVHGAPPVIYSKPAAQVNFYKVNGISKALKTALASEEKQISTLSSKWTKIYKEYKELGGNLLNIDKVIPGLLTTSEAGSQFLKIDDASAEYMKYGSTAANSALLGNLRPSDFFQGHGNVVSNELPAVQNQQTLLGDGSVKILIGLNPAGAPQVTLENDTSNLLNFSLMGAQATSYSIPPGGGQVSFTPGSQTDIQIFGGGGGAGKVWTATLSQAGSTFVGQMLIGLL